MDSFGHETDGFWCVWLELFGMIYLHSESRCAKWYGRGSDVFLIQDIFVGLCNAKMTSQAHMGFFVVLTLSDLMLWVLETSYGYW